MAPDLKTEAQFIKGVGPKLAEKLHKLGIETARDLIFYWPRRYEDYTNITKIGDIGNPIFDIRYSDFISVRARILGISNKLTSRQHMKITEAIIEDGTGTLKLIWFNQSFLVKILMPGSEWIFRGKVQYDSFNQMWVMESPSRVKKPSIIPIYPVTAGLSSLYIAKLVSSIKYQVSWLEDFLPDKILDDHKLLPLREAVLQIHAPVNFEQIEAARKRLAFDELFVIALRSRLAKAARKQEAAQIVALDKSEVDQFIKNLPFELTVDQKRAIEEIVNDMALNKPMNRLLNGDVGSGKTVVAAVAAYVAIKAGFRVALMVPTEVLATQHFETFLRLFSDDNISVGLLTSNIKKINNIPTSNVSPFVSAIPAEAGTLSKIPGQARNDKKNKRPVGNEEKPESAQLIIGTHALLQKGVNLENVSLVIVDEQHRFGVRQRAELQKIRDSDFLKNVPHFLSMTATPIPRTLHLALFGDLDISVISQKPKNRKVIKTRHVEAHNRQKAYQFIRSHIKAGRQVFVVCPLIEEKEDEISADLFGIDKKSVTREYDKLSKEIFPEFKVAMLHGRMKSKEKEAILSDFASGKSDILVSTSVIEVGIDVPNATIMMIEGAEKFGLAQIHQFRGRVGRGEHQSFCFLFSSSKSDLALGRLKSLETVSDGFELAEIDLEMRGPGDLFGTMQSGQLELKMASLSDRILIEAASRAATEIVQKDPNLEGFPAVKAKLAEFEANKHME